MEANPKLSSEISQVSEKTAQNRAKQGLILDLNPYWLAFYRLIDSGLDPYLFGRGPWPDFWVDDFLDILRFNDWSLPDLSRSFSDLDDFYPFFGRHKNGDAFQPFILRIIARSKPEASILDEEPYSYDEEREQLVNVAREARILTVVENQNAPSLIRRRRRRVRRRATGGPSGTMGGYLKDGISGKIFGVTCGHVIASGSAFSASGSILGPVAHSVAPTQLPQGVSCNQFCGYMTELDVALIEVNKPASNTATSVAGIVGNGQLVDMEGGATSGTHTYEIGGHVIDYEIGGSCWKDLIQFHAPLGGILPTSVRVATTPVPKGGDSGSWLIRNSTEWAGMVVAANSMFGLALASSQIVSLSDVQFGTQLSLA